MVRLFFLFSIFLFSLLDVLSAQPTPLMEVDFNTAAGDQSLVNRGALDATGTMSGSTAAFSNDVPPVNSGGWSASFHSNLGELEFTGDDKVDFGDLDELDGMSKFTFTAWVKSPEFHRNGSRMFSKGFGGIGFEFNMIGGTTPAFDGVPAFGIDDPNSTSTAFVSAAAEIPDLGGRLPLNTWGFVAASYDRDAPAFEHVTWYIGDGTDIGTAQENFPIGASTGSSAEPFLIGNYYFPDRVFKGLIDNVRIYDEVLTPEQVTAVMMFDDAAGGGVPGDEDGDGDVDGQDFLVIQRGIGTTHTSQDLADWQANYGTSSVQSAVTAVPEPTALVLSCLLGANMLNWRPRRTFLK